MGNGASHTRWIAVVQGERRASSSPEVGFSTVLGSCISACLYDPVTRIGGMNHFLLPGDSGAKRDGDAVYGAHLMELLVNDLMRKGAQRSRLEAKLFGGARIVAGLSDIGKKNAEFAARYLDYEGIRLVGQDVGGERARRLQFWPVTGRARVRYASAYDDRPDVGRPARSDSLRASFGDIELFDR